MINYKILINTDAFYKEGTPHILVTAIEHNDLIKREDKYNDVIGVYKKKSENIDKKDIQEMYNLSNTLKKDIIFLLENDKLYGWLFEHNADYREIQVFTTNDVNYDIWLDQGSAFWNPVDFLLNSEYYESEIDEFGFGEKIENIEKEIEKINSKVSDLIDITKDLKDIIERPL